jgi:hypothetical protein
MIMFAELELVMICSGLLSIFHHRDRAPSAGPDHDPP